LLRGVATSRHDTRVKGIDAIRAELLAPAS
jgi:hypothetical protein